MAQLTITDSEYGPLIGIISWILLSWTFFTIFIRGILRFSKTRRLDVDDCLILTSFVFATMQTILLFISTRNGLGQVAADVDPTALNRQLKTHYAANLLWIPSLLLAKFTMVVMLHQLSPQDLYRRMAIGAGVLVSLWALTSEFILAFECATPETWNYLSGKCINISAARNFITIVNLITEITLIILPCLIIARLNMAFRRRLLLAATFASRVSVIASLIAEIVYLERIDFAGDRSYTSWQAIVCQQFVQCTCLISTCIIYLRPFIESLESGFIRVDDVKRRGETRAYGSDASRNQASHGIWSQPAFSKGLTGSAAKEGSTHELGTLSKISGGKRNSGFYDENESGSEGIRQTQTFTVDTQRSGAVPNLPATYVP